MDITVNGYELSPPVISGVTKGSYKNERLNFIFDASWNDLVKTVTFYTPKREVVCLVTEAGMPIPDEVVNTVGVTRYVICGTDGARTVVTAEGAINIKSSLAVDLGSFEGRSPGVVEQITTYLKHSVDAYENAYEVASDAASSAASAQNAKNAACEAQSVASEMKDSAANSAKECEVWAEKLKISDKNFKMYVENRKLPMVVYDNNLPNSPRIGVMYFKKKSHSNIQNCFDKSVFMCQYGSSYYGWMCDEFVAYTQSENPEVSDAVYIKDSTYSIEERGSVTAVSDGVISVLIGEEEYECYRMSATDTEMGVFGWERILEATPMRRINTFNIDTDSIKAIISEDNDGNTLMLNEFYIKFTLKKSSNATSNSAMSLIVNGNKTIAAIPNISASEKVFVFHVSCMGDCILVRRIPLTENDLSEATYAIIDSTCPLYSVSIQGIQTNKIGAGSKVEIWGVDY